MQKHPESLIIKRSTLYRHTQGVGAGFHSFLTFALHENARSASAPAALPQGKDPPVLITQQPAKAPRWV